MRHSHVGCCHVIKISRLLFPFFFSPQFSYCYALQPYVFSSSLRLYFLSEGWMRFGGQFTNMRKSSGWKPNHGGWFAGLSHRWHIWIRTKHNRVGRWIWRRLSCLQLLFLFCASMLTLITLTGPHDFQLICTFFIYLLYLTFLLDFALVFWVPDTHLVQLWLKIEKQPKTENN